MNFYYQAFLFGQHFCLYLYNKQGSKEIKQNITLKSSITWIYNVLKMLPLYWPLTVTKALAVTIPAGFLASQRYRPSCSDFLASMISTNELLVDKALPFRYHVIWGTGNPSASHSKMIVSPSSMEMFWGSLIISGGTAKKQNEDCYLQIERRNSTKREILDNA